MKHEELSERKLGVMRQEMMDTLNQNGISLSPEEFEKICEAVFADEAMIGIVHDAIYTDVIEEIEEVEEKYESEFPEFARQVLEQIR